MITLQFVRGAGISSDLIAWWGNGYNGFSHVDAVLRNGRLFGARSDAIGGRPAGVWDRPQGYDISWTRINRVHIPCSEAMETKWEHLLLLDKAKPYDVRGILRFLVGAKPKYDGMWFCSALQESKLLKLQLIDDPGIPPEAVTPDVLHSGLCMRGYRAEEIKPCSLYKSSKPSIHSSTPTGSA